MSDFLAGSPTRNLQSLSERFRATRQLTEDLATPLSAEDQTVQSMPDVSPTKWHRAHTTWFFETFVLGRFDKSYVLFDPNFAFLFNSYYEAAGPRHARAARGLVSRPGIREIAEYRVHVDEAVEQMLENCELDSFVFPGWDLDFESTSWARYSKGSECSDADFLKAALVELGIQHEQQHQELILMDIKHVLWTNPLGPAYMSSTPRLEGRTRFGGIHDGDAWLANEGGLVEIGHNGPGFAFDNECPRHQVFLRPFALASRLVTNKDWLEFMDDGGYQRPELWLSDGWAAVQSQGWQAPLYWTRELPDRGEWMEFTLWGWQPVDLEAPVCHVSYYEADAFATWAGARLPTEAEWETVAQEVCGERESTASTQPFEARETSSMPERDLVALGNWLDLSVLRPLPRLGESDFQLLGDVWEWTSSSYLPYPGYRRPVGAIGEYNGKFMVSQHVLRGGSCVTPAGHVRTSYRNFFPPWSRWAFSGVRLARDQ
jgi:ergothioneine biosynthesis protein EgtB